MNPVQQMLSMVKSKQNPTQMIMSFLEQQAQSSPMG